MPYQITSTLRAIESKLLANGYFRHVQIGEPKSPPSEAFTGAVFMSDVSSRQVTLGTTIEVHTVTLRVYENMLREPQEDIEIDMAVLVSRVMADLVGEFDLGGTVRNIDVAGQYGAPLAARWGYLDVGGTMFRSVDITISLIVDDSGTLAA